MQYPLFVCVNPISVPTLFMDGPFLSLLQYMIFSETVWSFDDNARNTILDYSISLGNIKDRHRNRGLFGQMISGYWHLAGVQRHYCLLDSCLFFWQKQPSVTMLDEGGGPPAGLRHQQLLHHRHRDRVQAPQGKQPAQMTSANGALRAETPPPPPQFLDTLSAYQPV